MRHEIGHALGGGHTAMWWSDNATHVATMNPAPQGSGVIAEQNYIAQRSFSINEDDRDFIRDHYPSTTPNRRDVAVQSYIYDEAASLPSECSVWVRPSPFESNDLTAIAMAQGQPPGSCPFPDTLPPPVEPPGPLLVLPGSAVRTTFNLLNLGSRVTENPSARLILTTQDGPNPTSFTVVDTFTPGLTGNTPFERDVDFVVPNLSPGVYYVKLQLDHTGSISEADETNNEAFWNRQIQIVSIPSGCNCSTGAGAMPSVAGVFMVLLLVTRRRHMPSVA